MTGQEMLMRNLLKLLGVSPESVDQTFAELRGLGAYAKSVDARLANIEANQNRILALIGQRSSDEAEKDLNPALMIEHNNGDIHA